MGSIFNDLYVKGDLLNDDFFNSRFKKLDSRLIEIDDKATRAAAAAGQLVSEGLSRADEVLLPVFERIRDIAGLGAVFSAHSDTMITLGLGIKALTIIAGERDAYAPAAYIAVFKDGDLAVGFRGTVVSYDTDTGVLALDVDHFIGTGTHGPWVLHPTAVTDNLEAAQQALDHRDQAQAFASDAAGSAAAASDEADAALGHKTGAIVAEGVAITAKDVAVAAKVDAEAAVVAAEAARDITLSSMASFDLYYMGAFGTDPTVNNSGGALVNGQLYFNSTASEMRVYKTGTGWIAAYLPSNASVSSIFGRTGAVGSADGDYNAAQIVVTPAGGIAANRVQAALAELDTDKAPLASPALTGTPTAPTPAAADNTTKIATTAYVQGELADRALTSRSIATSGLATGGGNLTADRTISVPKGAAVDVRAATDDSKALTIKAMADAMAEVPLTYAANVAINHASGYDFAVTLTGDILFDNMTNVVVGKKGRIRVVQDATGSRIASFGANWEFDGGVAPSLSTAPNAEGLLYYDAISATRIFASLAAKATS